MNSLSSASVKQPELDFTPSLQGFGSRNVRVSSLRPGDWLENRDGGKVLVLSNSATKSRILLFYGVEHSLAYSEVYWARYRLIGHGKHRLWAHLLPEWLVKVLGVIPYTKP